MTTNMSFGSNVLFKNAVNTQVKKSTIYFQKSMLFLQQNANLISFISLQAFITLDTKSFIKVWLLIHADQNQVLILDNVDEIIASDEKSFYALLKSILERRKKVENSPDHVYGMVRYFDIRFYFEILFWQF